MKSIKYIIFIDFIFILIRILKAIAFLLKVQPFYFFSLTQCVKLHIIELRFIKFLEKGVVKMLSFKEVYQAHEDELTDSEEYICDYILAHRSQVKNMSITCLASNTSVVPNTITRLCKKLNYKGYTELKYNLDTFSEDSQAFSQRILFENTVKLINKKKEVQIINLFSKAKKVVFCASGETGNVGRYFTYAFNAVYNNSVFCSYTEEIWDILNHYSNLIVCMLSFSGDSEQTLKIAKLVKEKNIKLITVSDVSHFSPLAKMADIPLFCYSPNIFYKGYNLTNKMPMFIVLNSLLEQAIDYQK